MAADEKARALVERLVADLAPLEAEVNEAWWRTNVASSPEADAERIALEQKLSDYFADEATYAELAALAGEDIADADLARSVETLRLAFASEQTPAELRAELVTLGAECDSVYATFRGEAGGRRWSDNEIEQVLSDSDDDAERRAAWEASKQVGAEVAGRVRRLVEVRNDAARRLGYPHYYAMSLAFGELSEERLFALLDELDTLTAEPFRRMKEGLDARLRERFGVDTVMPWHYADPFFQDAPREAAVDLDPLVAGKDLTELTLRTYDGLGLELRPVVERSDLYGREGKNQHAFCLSVDRRDDVRVLCNVIDNERWASTMLHEFGHAAYDVYLGDDLPWALRRPAHSLTTEAVAQLFGRLSKDAGWLRDVAGVPESELVGVDEQVAAALRAHMLVFARWVLVMCHFERGLYADPAADHDTRWWDLVERFQLVPRPPGRHAPDWAAKLHLALAPVYYQNYVLGELFASQLQATVEARGGRLYDDRETGEWLRRSVFGPGARLRWDRLVEQATGERISARAFAKQFV
ncbi:MAG TPA: M2 family metallopeptidase [Mycobacteriales bacterium]|nr:M2 family metallopeptidase [Mycobacteriales bacterium]